MRMTRVLVNIFIIFHLAAFICWSSPFEWELRNKFVNWITPYMLWSGLWQGWDMFAPDPLSINAHLEALITFRDGTQATWVFPRMDKLGYFERYRKERYRKWASSYVRLDSYSAIWPSTSRYIARQFSHLPNPPIEVELKRYWTAIPPPYSSLYQPFTKGPSHSQNYTFYTYLIRQEDLS